LALGLQIDRYFGIINRLTLCIQSSIGPYRRYIRTVENDGNCQDTNYNAHHGVVL